VKFGWRARIERLCRRARSFTTRAGCSTLGAIEIIGHRGASHDAPENTLASFRLGWAQRADANELDIRLTRDGQIVVFHDATTRRIAGLDRPVAAQTLAELQALDAGSWKGVAWAGEKIPALPEVLATVPDGKRLYLEIKCGVEVLPALQQVIAKARIGPEQVALIGFGLATMAAAKMRLPKHDAYWVVENKEPPPPLGSLISQAKAAGLDGLDLQGTFPIDGPLVENIKAAGLKLCTWTVNDLPTAKRLLEAGVDGITTNRPGWLREQLGL
jgi:glycerophosphoryl diester phosphodiesterase